MIRARALDGAEARISELEQRVDEVERQIAELSRAIEDFSAAVTNGFNKQIERADQLQTLLTEMRAANDLHRGGSVIDLPDFRRRAN